ncbi:enoyl-[acyl-carrier-protein] reductase [NADPH] FabL [Abditibacteriota bacterium]|nr:enoyl-[acyl-carrier-protein] reductase [NADPH] FabL [Abditibacteriota bacterium]
MQELNGKVALVTGASRGIGAAVSRLLSEYGADIIINFRSKGPRAEEVAEAVRSNGRRAFLAQADITSEAEVEAMIEVAKEAGHIDVLVLNASGGLEKGKSADYAMNLNLTAQERVVNLALPLMPTGGRIVFITSHLAHFYGEKPVPAMYVPVATSKKAGEDALRARIPELAEKGISLVVVSGDMIEGTITPKLMERANRGTIETRRQQAGSLPTVEEFAQAIIDAATDTTLQSGAVIFVGQID